MSGSERKRPKLENSTAETAEEDEITIKLENRHINDRVGCVSEKIEALKEVLDEAAVFDVLSGYYEVVSKLTFILRTFVPSDCVAGSVSSFPFT